MISAICKSPVEVFAHSLQAKLEDLGKGNSDPEDPTLSRGRKTMAGDWYLRTRSWSADVNGTPKPGTTFPPSNGISFQLLRAKYHSESDLLAGVSLKNDEDIFHNIGGKDEDRLGKT